MIEALEKHKDNAAMHLADRIHLQHHCGMCGQWVVDASKMKQHFLLSRHAWLLQNRQEDCALDIVNRDP